MIAAPHALLERSIGELEILAATLAEEMGSGCDGRRPVTPEARVCNELLLSISVLLPKLQAARYVLPQQSGLPDAAVRSTRQG
jgi:hypothetical protein